MKVSTLLLVIFISVGVNAQSMIEKMFKQKRYEEIVAQAPNSARLGGRDLFRIGQSYMKLKQDEEAIDMFSKAINKGYENGEVYYARGIAETNLDFYTAAERSFRQALFYMPKRKKVLIELAACYYKNDELDSALVTYQTIEKNWGDYWPALVMSCQILHEQGKNNKALDCYYTKLPHLKKEKYYYRTALESVMRIEWHTFNNYPKTELAIKNLMDAFPKAYEYNMLLMQLYNTTGRYEEARVQEDYLLQAYADLNLAEQHYKKGAMVMEQLDTAQYTIEVFRNFQPEKSNGIYYKAFVFNYNGSRPLGKVEGVVSDTLAMLNGYQIDLPLETDNPMTYEEFKYCLIHGLFLPEITHNEFIDPE